MGAKVGKALYVEAARPFVNLSAASLEDLWEAWNDVAEGFGVDKEEATEIFTVLQEALDMPKKPLASLTELVFDVYDTDNNKLNDALEIIGSLCVASGMRFLQKMNFLFTMYDFDESQELTIDEMTLLFKSTCVGLAKITDDVPPTEPEVEALAHDALLGCGKTLDDRITKHEFLAFCRRSAEIRNWAATYDDSATDMDATDAGGGVGGSFGQVGNFSGLTPDEMLIPQFREEGVAIDRTTAEVAAMDPQAFITEDFWSTVVTDTVKANDPKLKGGDAFRASLEVKDRQWVQLLDSVAPSTAFSTKAGPPEMSVTLGWVYGYKGRGARNTVWYTHTHEVCYPAASVVVLFSRERNSQEFLMGHTDEITCMAVHSEPGFTRIATGELGVRPKIIVWDLTSMQATHTTSGLHTRSITHLAFNPDGSKLVSVGGDAGHTVAAYNLAKDGTMQLLYSSLSHRNRVLDCQWVSAERYVSGGSRHIYFWEPSEVNSVIVKTKGLFGRAGVHTVTAIAGHPANAVDGAVTGTVSGKLLVWRGRNVERIINAHDRPVLVLRYISSVGLISGGLDSRVRIWFPDVTPGLVFDLNHLGSLLPAPQSLDWNYANNKILLSTGAHEVFEVSDTDGSDLNAGPLLQAHFAGEVHCVSAHPVRDEICTVGDDGTVRVFDLISHRLLRLTRLDGPCRAVAYSPDGSMLAVGMGAPQPSTPYNHYEAATDLGGQAPGTPGNMGTPAGATTGVAAAAVGSSLGGAAAMLAAARPNKNGAFVILSDMELLVQHEARDSKEWIRSVAWSPDGQTLAVGSSDMDTYLYYTSDWSAKGKCRGSKYGVSAIDFSADSAYLRTSCYGPGQDDVSRRGIGGGLAAGGVSALEVIEDMAKPRPTDGLVRKKPGAGAGGATRGGRGTAPKAPPKRRTDLDHPGYQILFWDAGTGEPLRSLVVLKEVDWATANCPLAWEVQGAWPGAGKGVGDGLPPVSAGGSPLDKALAAARPSVLDATRYADRFVDVRSTMRSIGGDTVAAVDEFGRLRLARYPWLSPDQACHELRGHSTSVSKVVFTTGDGYVVTTGARDRCVFQWTVELSPREDAKASLALASAGTTAVLEDQKAGEDDDDDDADSIDEEMEHKDDAYDREAAVEAMYNRDMVARFNLEDAAAKGRAADPVSSKPWKNTAHPPTEPPEMSLAPPPENLRLEWVHGYRGQDTRNNVRYSARTEILFPASSVAVAMKAQEDGTVVQRFYQEHTDEILCLQVHPAGKVTATGQVGRLAKILVWDNTTMATLSELYGHFRGVSHCAFSPIVDGTGGHLLASVGLDEDHTVLVHDWRSGQLVAKCPGNAAKTLDVSWHPDGEEFVVSGVNHTTFYQVDGVNLVRKNAIMGSKGQMQKMMTIAWAGKSAVLGTGTGKLYKFMDNQLDKVFNAHVGAVMCSCTVHAGIVTGGRDNTVKMWNSNLDMQRSFDVSALERCLVPAVRSVWWDSAANRIVLGTAGSEIYEISSLNGMDINAGPLVQSHFQGEVWALATHPTKGEFVTVGDDQTVRVWDVATKSIIGSTDLDAAGRAVAYAPDAIRICVGLGGKPLPPSTKVKLDGGFMILDARDLSIVHEGRDSKEWITDVKYSADGATLAVGSRDSKIYLYDIPGAYALKGVFSQHQAFVTSIDFSSDGTYLCSNDGTFDLLFSNDAAEYIAQASSLVDVKWNSSTCTLSWGTKGLWQPVNDGTVWHACDRSREGSALVASDNFGRLQLSRFPFPDPRGLAKTYFGHVGPVQRVRWTANDTHVISIGATDRCVFQWRVGRDKDDESTPAGKEADDPDLFTEFDNLPDDEAADADAEFDAVKPWVTASVQPTRQIKPHPSPPDAELVLDWVHGYRADDARSNLSYNQAGDVVYHTAGLGVIYQTAKHQQLYYRGHNGRDIGSCGVDPRGRFAATGELGAKPRVHVWDAVTGAPVKRLDVFHRRGVSIVEFSQGPKPGWKAALPTTVALVEEEGAAGAGEGVSGGPTDDDDVLIGKAGVVGVGGADGSLRTEDAGWDDGGYRLVSVGLDEDHTVAVWRSADGSWRDAKLVAASPSSKEKVLFACFIDSTNNKPCQLATGGVRHMTFWQISGRTMVPFAGVFGRKGRQQSIASATVYNGKLVTGTATGHLYVWTDRTVSRAIAAHDKTINTLDSTGDVMVSGSKDGTIKVWGNGADIAMLAQFDLNDAKPKPFNASIRSVRLLTDKLRSVVLVGTKASEVYELSRLTSRMIQLSSAHCVDEVWGLAPHPTDPDLYLTCGDDKSVRLWSASKHRQLAMVVLDNHMRACAWSPDGSIVCVGYGGRVGTGRSRRDGAFLLLKAADLSLIHEGQDSRDWITDIKFSADGSMIAMASQDSKVYLYILARNRETGDVSIKLSAKCEMSNTAVRHVDFDAATNFVQTCDVQGEYIMYTTEDGERVTHPSELKDIDWASWTCTYGFPMLGAWPELGTEVTSCHRDATSTLLATAEDTGRIKLFRYPASQRKQAYRVAYGHSGTPRRVRFTADSKYVLSVGGSDKTLVQWRLDAVKE